MSRATSEKAIWANEYRKYQQRSTIFLRELVSAETRLGLDLGDDLYVHDQECNYLAAGLKKIRVLVSNARQQLGHAAHSPTRDLARLQKLLTTAESEFTTYKSAARDKFEELAAEEKSLCKDLAAFEKRMECWDKEDEGLTASQELDRRKEVRVAIDKWRSEKENERQRAVAEEVDRLAEEQEAVKAAAKQPTPEERAEAKVRIFEWQQQRALAETTKRQSEAQRQVENKLAAQQRLLQDAAAKKEQLLQWKEARDAERMVVGSPASQCSGGERPTAAQLQLLVERDLRKAEEKRRRALEAQEAALQAQAALERIASTVKPTVKRDAARLTRPTTAALTRAAATSDGLNSSPMSVRNHQRRAVPLWRQGL
eukprot:TRINITY_DN14031_c0_g1_i1.p1 TRINITY_DN14031_c0_g1~~TRINITY_DN14031_c0_g1_i1.p1  ORF type:complete len:370 (+),score=102.04 TRINITY_DN14031_c0_g1_i1:29-1138(+)